MKRTLWIFAFIACLVAMQVIAHATVIETKKGPVYFDHSTHTGSFRACLECHDIHNLADKNASHAFCKGCHQDLGQGPTKCKGCHIK